MVRCVVICGIWVCCIRRVVILVVFTIPWGPSSSVHPWSIVLSRLCARGR